MSREAVQSGDAASHYVCIGKKTMTNVDHDLFVFPIPCLNFHLFIFMMMMYLDL